MLPSDPLTAALTRLVAEWLPEQRCPCLVDPHGPKECSYCGGVTTPHSKRCENCSGSGLSPVGRLVQERMTVKCRTCHGTGHYDSDHGQYSVAYNCAACGGDGQKLPQHMDSDWTMNLDGEIGVRGTGLVPWLPTSPTAEGREAEVWGMLWGIALDAERADDGEMKDSIEWLRYGPNIGQRSIAALMGTGG